MLCFICIVSHLTLHRNSFNIDHQLCDDIRWLYSQLPLTQEELGRQLEVQYCQGTVNKWINKKHDGEKIRVAMKNWARGQLRDAKKRKSPLATAIMGRPSFRHFVDSPFEVIPTSQSTSRKRKRAQDDKSTRSRPMHVQPYWTELSKKISENMWLGDSKTTLPGKSQPFSTTTSGYTVKKIQASEEVKFNLCREPLWRILEKSLSKQYFNIGGKRRKACTIRKQQTAGSAKSSKLPAEKSIKIRLYPNQEQRKTLIEWFGTARWTYNYCLDYLHQLREEGEAMPDVKDIRHACIQVSNFKGTKLDWVTRTPSHVRDDALSDLWKAYKSCFAKGNQFTIKHRTKKNKQQSIVIRHVQWGRKSGKFAFLPTIRTSETIPPKEELVYDMRLVMDRIGHFYLCLPKPLEV